MKEKILDFVEMLLDCLMIGALGGVVAVVAVTFVVELCGYFVPVSLYVPRRIIISFVVGFAIAAIITVIAFIQTRTDEF